RVSSKVWIAKLNGKNAPELAQKTIDLLMPLKNIIHTITGDNGKEFADHQTIRRELAVDFYFAHPYHPWER
ncbi:IS30 family transposase, partial [Vibrio parahaemolyticus]